MRIGRGSFGFLGGFVFLGWGPLFVLGFCWGIGKFTWWGVNVLGGLVGLETVFYK